MQILQILEINEAYIAVSRDNYTRSCSYYIVLYMLCLLPSLDDHVIIIYFLYNQGHNQI
jgi:hypothetical protein